MSGWKEDYPQLENILGLMTIAHVLTTATLLLSVLISKFNISVVLATIAFAIIAGVTIRVINLE